MTPISIHAALKEAGFTMSDVARHHDVAPSTVRKVIYGQGVSRPIAETIATLLGKTAEDLWPGKYPTSHTQASANRLLSAQARISAALAKNSSARAAA